ncbi:EamA family transporter [Pseudoduganella sp. LjRoot289]|uniref:DMT family transporter n=1 Tax=Pseudoduganella sp. LjRoot289 TaxID=3342314 RepID=UPI003ECE5383
MSPYSLFLVILVPFIWGLQAVMLKIGLHQFPPIFMVGMRFVMMSLILLPFIGGIKGKLGPALLVSLTQGVAHFALLYIGFRLVDVSTGIIAYQTNAIFTVILGGLLLRERITKLGMAGILTAFSGVALIVGGPKAGGSTEAMFIIIGSAFMFAVGNITARRYGPMKPAALNAVVSLAAGPALLLISFLFEQGQVEAVRHADLTGWGALLYTVLAGGIAGFGIWYWLLNKYPVDKIAPFGLLMPFFAMLGSVILLHENITAMNMLGAVLTVAGVAIAQFGKSWAAWFARPAPLAKAG